MKRVYLEASGIFSIYKAKEEKPGLPTLPPDDSGIIKQQHMVTLLACINCGFLKEPDKANGPCRDCGHDKWTNAINNTAA